MAVLSYLRLQSLPGIFEKAVNLQGYVKADKVENTDGHIKIVSTGNMDVKIDNTTAKIEID